MSTSDEPRQQTGKVDQIKRAVRASTADFLSDRDIRRVDNAIDTLVRELATTASLDRSDIEANITGFSVVKRNDTRDVSVNFARRQNGPIGGGHGHLPWPLDCHKKFELCWPHPDNPELLVCLEVEIPWPCPDEIIL